MTGVDRAWLRMDEPANLMMINGVLLFDEPVDHGRLRDVLERRLLTVNRFRQRVECGTRGRHHWEVDPSFDLDNHLLRERLPEPGGDAELRQCVSRWMSRPLDPQRPLWQVHQIDNHEGGSALLWRLHHCIGDGMVLMLVLLSLTEMSDGVLRPGTALDGPHDAWQRNPLRLLFGEAPLSAEEAKEHLARLLPEAVKLLARPSEAMRSVSRWVTGSAAVPALGRLALRRADPKTLFKGQLGIEKRVAWSRAVPLDEVDALRESLGGTVNDLLLTAVAGGLRRYLVSHGESADGLNFRAVVPVSLRPLEQMAALGNQFGLVFLSLPIGLAHPAERLAELRRRMSGLKRSVEPLVVLALLRAIGMTPRAVQDLVVRIFGTKGTAVMTNLPGPRQTLYLAGKPIRSFLFWVPQSGRLGMGISIGSYAGAVRLGVATDALLVADPEGIVEGFHHEFEAMRSYAAG